jgi:hypothetical protein
MLQSERLRYIQKQATTYVSRTKCNDSSLQTLVVQAKASGIATPLTVALSCGAPATNYATAVPTDSKSVRVACGGVATGKGTNREYIGILQAKQGCAICATESTTQGIQLPVPCVNQNAPPFTQQDMTNPYIPPCTPGNNTFFPPKIFDGPGCTYSRNTTPS